MGAESFLAAAVVKSLMLIFALLVQTCRIAVCSKFVGPRGPKGRVWSFLMKSPDRKAASLPPLPSTHPLLLLLSSDSLARFLS